MIANPVNWFEIYVEDMARAKTFYEGVFSVSLEKLNSPEIDMWAFPMNAEGTGTSGALVYMPGLPSGGNSTLTDGKADERPFVSKIINPGQTCVLDRYYQKHQDFDTWENDQVHYVCRIKEGTRVEVVYPYETPKDSIVYFDAIAQLGSQEDNQTDKPVRLVKYAIEGTNYLVATNRFDLEAEDIALIYKLRWDIEKFFAWWKRQFNVYHLIARTQYGLMVQIVSGSITYLLLAIYCHNEHGEKVNIRRIRELHANILNEALTSKLQQRRRKSKTRKKKRKRSRAKS